MSNILASNSTLAGMLQPNDKTVDTNHDDLAFLDSGLVLAVKSFEDIKFDQIDHEAAGDDMAIMAQDFCADRRWNISSHEMNEFKLRYVTELGTRSYGDDAKAAEDFMKVIKAIKILDGSKICPDGETTTATRQSGKGAIAQIKSIIADLPGTRQQNPIDSHVGVCHALVFLPSGYLTALLAHTRNPKTSAKDIMRIETLFRIITSGFVAVNIGKEDIMGAEDLPTWREFLIPFWNDRVAFKSPNQGSQVLRTLSRAVVLASKLEIVDCELVLSALDEADSKYPCMDKSEAAVMYGTLHEHIRFMAVKYGMVRI